MEGNEDPINSLTTSGKTLDSAAQKKHEAMLQRLSARSSSRKAHSSSSESSSAAAASFVALFSDAKRSIDSGLARCSLAASAADPNLKSDLDKLSASIADLERLVAERSYSLPSYEVRSSLKTISDLRETLEALNSELLPKKKFAFRSKGPKKDQIFPPKEAKAEALSLGFEKANVEVRKSPGFRNADNASLVRDFRVLDSEVGEFAISDLSNCVVRLMGSVRALFVHRLRNCKVYGGPVFGSILIEEVEGCVFVLASHQIRIHHAKETDFYLRVRSQPIIEDASSVRFAPYCLHYKGIEQDLRDAGLDEETGNWANVGDFKWLRAVPSPNWSILPEKERIAAISISDEETLIKDS